MIYLDNSATTKPCKMSCDFMLRSLENNWGNPSSLHSVGIEAEIALNKSRKVVSDFIGADEKEIIFTGSGTEANNTALLSVADKSWGNRVITTQIEHPSVLNTVKRLESRGFEVIRLKPGKDGKISIAELESVLTPKTVLVSMMLVNNEIGSIQPVEQAVKLTRKLAPRAVFHTDAVQAFGKMPISVKKLGVDMLSASGHKIHAPKGIGFLYCAKNCKIPPFLTGGGQERGLRSGTEPVPLCAALEGAICALPRIEPELKQISELRDYARESLEKTGFAVVNSPKDALPYILNISVPGFRSETLLHFLEMHQIFVSSGSACAKGETSYVLSALGLTAREIDSALRISFSRENGKQDIDTLCEVLKSATESLRKSQI